jgi:glycosyltransferase involved in cell wall biosynthesis
VILAKDNSAEAFAAAVSETVQRNQGERIARGRVIADAFDWKRVGGRILDVFHRAVGSPGHGAGARSRSKAAA